LYIIKINTLDIFVFYTVCLTERRNKDRFKKNIFF